MKNLTRVNWVGVLALAPALLGSACGGYDNGVGPPPGGGPTAQVAGSWVGTWRIDVDEAPRRGSGKDPRPASRLGRQGSIKLSLRQHGSAVTGSVAFTGSVRGRYNCLGEASVAGLVAADVISLTLTNGASSAGKVHAQVTGNTLSGSFASSCAESGTLVLHRE
jgi:hypothetical protein